MSELAYDIQLVAPGPNAVKNGQASNTGKNGTRSFFYWVVAHFPIGVSVSEPIPIINAPDVLSGTDAVRISWETEIGATTYDVLRTATPSFPTASGNYVVTGGITPGAGITTAIDTGAALTVFNPTALTYGAPVTRHIYLNNRDYSQPTIQLPAVNVAGISFPDGTTMNSVAAASGQSPWVGDVNGAGFRLINTGDVGIGNDGTPLFPEAGYIDLVVGSTVPNDSRGGVITIVGDAQNWGLYLYFADYAVPTKQLASISILRAETPTAARYMYIATQSPADTIGSFLTLDSSGHIGVGTETPAYAFDVSGDVGIGPAPRTAVVSVPEDGAANSGAIVFSTRLAGVLAERARISAAGELSVLGTVNSVPAAGDAIFQATAGGVSVRLTAVTTGIAYIGTFTNHPVAIYANNGERMRVMPDGKVAIGLSTPAYMLDVAGDINIPSASAFRVGGVPISTGVGSQTPWLTDIDGGGHTLANVSAVHDVNEITTPGAASKLIVQGGLNVIGPSHQSEIQLTGLPLVLNARNWSLEVNSGFGTFGGLTFKMSPDTTGAPSIAVAKFTKDKAFVQSIPPTLIDDAELPNSSMSIWYDELASRITFRVKSFGGVYKTGTLVVA
jgi:hypothetical protein